MSYLHEMRPEIEDQLSVENKPNPSIYPFLKAMI
jgi:hypothetical protein